MCATRRRNASPSPLNTKRFRDAITGASEHVNMDEWPRTICAVIARVLARRPAASNRHDRPALTARKPPGRRPAAHAEVASERFSLTQRRQAGPRLPLRVTPGRARPMRRSRQARPWREHRRAQLFRASSCGVGERRNPACASRSTSWLARRAPWSRLVAAERDVGGRIRPPPRGLSARSPSRGPERETRVERPSPTRLEVGGRRAGAPEAFGQVVNAL